MKQIFIQLAALFLVNNTQAITIGENQLLQTEPLSLAQEKYGDVTVFITPKEADQQNTIEPPERYSQDSDDTLMNMLITKGYAFSKEQKLNGGSNYDVAVDCGCNCQCCFGQLKTDLWEISKDCGCDCGCCSMNHYKTKMHAPQYWIDKKGAEKASRDMITRNLKLTGEKLEEYMNFHFGTLWADYDVLKNDLVEIERMSAFFKTLLKDFKLSI